MADNSASRDEASSNSYKSSSNVSEAGGAITSKEENTGSPHEKPTDSEDTPRLVPATIATLWIRGDDLTRNSYTTPEAFDEAACPVEVEEDDLEAFHGWEPSDDTLPINFQMLPWTHAYNLAYGGDDTFPSMTLTAADIPTWAYSGFQDIVEELVKANLVPDTDLVKVTRDLLEEVFRDWNFLCEISSPRSDLVHSPLRTRCLVGTIHNGPRGNWRISDEVPANPAGLELSYEESKEYVKRGEPALLRPILDAETKSVTFELCDRMYLPVDCESVDLDPHFAGDLHAKLAAVMFHDQVVAKNMGEHNTVWAIYCAQLRVHMWSRDWREYPNKAFDEPDHDCFCKTELMCDLEHLQDVRLGARLKESRFRPSLKAIWR